MEKVTPEDPKKTPWEQFIEVITLKSSKTKVVAILIVAVALLVTVFNCNSCNAQDMYYEKCATMPALLPGWAIEIVDMTYDTVWDCHSPGFYNGSGDYKVMTYTTNIVCMGDTACEVNMEGLYFEECHFHWHLGLIDTEILDLQGNVLITGAKLGYDWVDSGQFDTEYPSQMLDCRLSAIAEYGGWTDPNVPPNDRFNSGNLGMTQGYQDTYTNSYANNWIVLGHYDALGNYVGLGDGDYIFHSRANFDALLDQGANNFPDEFSFYINITNGIVTEIDPPVVTVPPTEPANFQVNYKNNLSAEPFVSWVGDADYFELERWVQHGNSNAQANTVNVLGNTFIDSKNDLLSAALILLGTDKGIKFFYKIRAVNSAGASNWILSDIVKL